MKLEKWLVALVLGATSLAFTVTPALAQGTDAPAEGAQTLPPEGVVAPEEEEDPLGISLGVDYTTAYFFRGYNIEDTGYIFQPFASVEYAIELEDGWSLTPHAGVWNSIHEETQGGDDGWEHLFETDW